MAIGFDSKEISGGPGRSREVREVEMAAVDSSCKRPFRSWYRRWVLRQCFSVSERSSHSAFMILRDFSLSVLEEVPQESLALNHKSA